MEEPRLKYVKGHYYLLSTELAKEGEYALTAMGTRMKVDLNKVVLWENGCKRVIATSDTYFAIQTGIKMIAVVPERDTLYPEFRCNIAESTANSHYIVISNITPVHKHQTDLYQEWLEFNRKNNRELEPMTNNKAKLAEKLLTDKELVDLLSYVGVFDDIFQSVYYFLKHR